MSSKTLGKQGARDVLTFINRSGAADPRYGFRRNRQARRFILGICHKFFQPSCACGFAIPFARLSAPGVTDWNARQKLETDIRETRETRMRFIIDRSMDWNSLSYPTTRRLNCGRIDLIPLAYARID